MYRAYNTVSTIVDVRKASYTLKKDAKMALLYKTEASQSGWVSNQDKSAMLKVQT